MVNIQYNIAIYNITLHHDITQRTHARLFLERIDAFLPLVPTSIGRASVRVRVRVQLHAYI